jgi:hypothetical protein
MKIRLTIITLEVKMAEVRSKSTSPVVNPLVKDLLDAGGGGQVLMIGGFIGPTADDHIRLYADLGLSKYVEIAKTDVVRVVEAREKPEERCIVFFRSAAELRYVQTMSVKADQALTAFISRPPARGCHGSAPSVVARESGPTVDVSEWMCIERAQLCLYNARSPWDAFWCVLDYILCRSKGSGPIIV